MTQRSLQSGSVAVWPQLWVLVTNVTEVSAPVTNKEKAGSSPAFSSR